MTVTPIALVARSGTSPAPLQVEAVEVLRWLAGAPAQIVLTLLFAVAARWLGHRAINQVVATSIAKGESLRRAREARGISGEGNLTERYRQRATTMGSMLRSVVTVVVSVVTALTLLAILGVPLAPLLASAGVGGVALGIGAQSLVRDYLSGVFMIIEDQYGVGDVVDLGDAVGTVEEVTLRVTRLRDADGVVWYVRNGEVLRVANRSQGWSTAMVDIAFSYRENVDRVTDIIRAEVDAIDHDDTWRTALLEKPQVLGVESVQGGAVTVRVLAKCAPEKNWGVQREIRRRVKDAFDREGIAVPPQPPVAGADHVL